MKKKNTTDKYLKIICFEVFKTLEKRNTKFKAERHE